MVKRKFNHTKQKILMSDQKKVKHDFKESNARGATFWMSLSDFSKYFYLVTICAHNLHYKQSFC